MSCPVPAPRCLHPLFPVPCSLSPVLSPVSSLLFLLPAALPVPCPLLFFPADARGSDWFRLHRPRPGLRISVRALPNSGCACLFGRHPKRSARRRCCAHPRLCREGQGARQDSPARGGGHRG